jgi:hypothetical protein
MQKSGYQDDACCPRLLLYMVGFQNKSALVKHTWNSRSGTMGDCLVKTSLVAPATNKTQPTIRSEIVDTDDPSEDIDIGELTEFMISSN